jgi:hypothetical protein
MWARSEMAVKLRHLLQECLRSPVFGDSYASSLAYEDVERRIKARGEAFASSFAPMMERGMPDVPAEVRDSFVRKMTLTAAGLFSIVPLELADTDRLTAAAVCVGLNIWGDTFMDRGDVAMETAVQLLVEDYCQSSLPAGVPPQRSEGANRRVSRATAAVSPVVGARLGALRSAASQIAYMCRLEDEAALRPGPCLNSLKRSLLVRRLCQQYLRDKRADFWKEHAEAWVEHSVTSIQFLNYVGLLYALYRHEPPALPSFGEVLGEPLLVRFLDGFVSAAMRLFDDLGDRKIDTGSTPYNQFSVNLFNNCDPALIRAFLRFAGVTDDKETAYATEALCAGDREGDAAITQFFVTRARAQMEALPGEILRRYDVFITLAKRSIEAGYVNTIGDQSLYHSE